jgi:hypothetical protein
MTWIAHQFGPRRRLAGAMLLAMTVALAGSLFAAPASVSADEDNGIKVRRVKLDDGRGVLVLRTSDEGRVLRKLHFERGDKRILLHSGRLLGTRWGFGHRFLLPPSSWWLLHPYLGMPFGHPFGFGLGPMVVTTRFHHPDLFVGSIGLGDREWLRFRDD